jgi:predicted hotdog family 3-hydroxylacyl-ACP dehydratase
MNVDALRPDIRQMIDFSDVASLLPHSGAMVLIDRIMAFDEDSLTAELAVRGDGLLGGDSRSVPAWAGIEYMAQAIGAYVGICARLAGEPIKLGYLLGTRRYEGNVSAIPVGSLLTVVIKKIIQDDQLGVFDCKIFGENIEIHANLNVFQPPIAVEFKKNA